jgi:hypothetical protein
MVGCREVLSVSRVSEVGLVVGDMPQGALAVAVRAAVLAEQPEDTGLPVAMQQLLELVGY